MARKYQLLVVSHPDDESLFFSGLLLQERKLPWDLVVLTDGNADGKSKRRALELKRAAKSLGIRELYHWSYPDIFEKRLPVEDIALRLGTLDRPERVFSHGPLGEYGHPHHQDACLAVYRAFYGKVPVYSLAHNCMADLTINLSKKNFAQKSSLFSKIYFEETKRFIHFLPALSQEGYAAIDRKEVEALYRFFTRRDPIHPRNLQRYRWFMPYLKLFRTHIESRPF